MTGRERITYLVRVTAAHALYYMGLLRVWQSVVLRHKAVVLMYHRVLSCEQRGVTASHSGIIVDETTFAAQMEFLKQRFHVLSMDEFVDRLVRGVPFQSSSCVITFDDGWRDNFERALPILVRFGLPAIVFLPVNYIGGHRSFWQEALTDLLWQAADRAKTSPLQRNRLEELLAPHALAGVLDAEAAGSRAGARALAATMRHENVSVIEQLLADLASALGVELAETSRTDGFMNWDQVRAMSRLGVAFGGHGAEHRVLTRVPTHEADAEIRRSKEVLDSRLSQNTVAFAYPNGDWNGEVADAVRRNGFAVAFTTEPGAVTCSDDRFALRRVNVHDDMTRTVPMFLARLTGLF